MKKKKDWIAPLRRPLIEPRPWHFFSGGSGDKKIRNKNKRSRGEGRKNAKVRFLSLSFGGAKRLRKKLGEQKPKQLPKSQKFNFVPQLKQFTKKKLKPVNNMTSGLRIIVWLSQICFLVFLCLDYCSNLKYRRETNPKIKSNQKVAKCCSSNYCFQAISTICGRGKISLRMR